MRRTTSSLVILAGLAASLSACAPRYDGFECELLNSTPSGALCTDQRIEVAQGEAMVARLAPLSDSRTEYEDARIELRATEPQVAEVRPGVGGEQTVIGLTVGQTVFEVWVDGEQVSDVPVHVIPFEPSGGHD